LSQRHASTDFCVFLFRFVMACRKKSKKEPLYMSHGTTRDITGVSACFDHVTSTVLCFHQCIYLACLACV
jgi:hypothetical protein